MSEIYRDFLQVREKKAKGCGRDSIVYKHTFGSDTFAIKTYNSSLLLSELMDYYKLSNQATQMKDLCHNFFGINIPVTINPILDIVCDGRQLVSISPWIDGPRMYDIYSFDRCGYILNSQLPTDISWLSRLSEDIKNQSHYPYFANTLDISRPISGQFKAEGIDVDPINIKITSEGLVVTDLCTSITSLVV